MGREKLHGLVLVLMLSFLFLTEAALAEDSITIAYTGHTYPLMMADLQYYMADAINAHNCDIVVLGGDLVVGTETKHLRHTVKGVFIREEQWDKVGLFTSRLKGEVHIVPGNHDFYAGEQFGAESIKKLNNTEKIFHSKKIHNVLLVFLSTVDISDSQKVRYQLDSEQLAWLKNLLQSKDDVSTVLMFMHHQYWNMTEWPRMNQPDWGDVKQFQREIKPLLSKFGGVHLFAGDLGQIHSTVKGGIHYYNMSNMLKKSGFFIIKVSPALTPAAVSVKRYSLDIGLPKVNQYVLNR